MNAEGTFPLWLKKLIPGKNKNTSDELRRQLEELGRKPSAVIPVNPPSILGPTPSLIPLDLVNSKLTESAENRNCLMCAALGLNNTGTNVVVLGDLATMDTVDFRCCDRHIDTIKVSHQLIKWDGTKRGDMCEIERAPNEHSL